MFYIATIDVPARKAWGGIYTADVILPGRVRRIRGLMPMAHADFRAMRIGSDGDAHSLAMRQMVVGSERDGRKYKYFFADSSYQTGTLSATLNGGETLLDSAPVQLLQKLRRRTYNTNRVDMGNMSVPGGSLLRLSYNERNLNPFAEDGEISDDGLPVRPYAVKLYIDYTDK